MPLPVTFQLDTSGGIRLVPAASDPDGPIYRWVDLTPFQQGYVEALLCPWPVGTDEEREASAGAGPAFSDLAPATLGRILEDCAVAAESFQPTKEAGAAFWQGRQAFKPTIVRAPRESGQKLGLRHWPRLTVSLGDDGLVYLTEGVKP